MHSPSQFIPSRPGAAIGIAAILIASGLAVVPQAPSPQSATAGERSAPEVRAITESELQHQLQGKFFYLRGRYSDNDLRFDHLGQLSGNSPQTSYTLSLVQIQKVHLTKRKLDLEGIRYGLHFLGSGPTEDPLAASNKVRITPKKKVLKISIERAEVLKPKKTKHSKDDARRHAPANAAREEVPQQTAEPSDVGSQGGVAVSTQAQANQFLEKALDSVFARGMDERMIASLPDFWRSYFNDAAARTSFKPSDPSALLQSAADQKARLLGNFGAPSNELAQAAGVAGVAQYHVVVGRDGKPEEVAVDRPIGFGLDENTVDSIRKASFQPAMKDGKTVPVLLNLMVEFRIYSAQTAPGAAEPDSARVSEPEAPSLPGPYTANEPVTKQQ